MSLVGDQKEARVGVPRTGAGTSVSILLSFWRDDFRRELVVDISEDFLVCFSELDIMYR